MRSRTAMANRKHLACYSSFEPVTGLYRDLAGVLSSSGWAAEFVLSGAEYAKRREGLEEAVAGLRARVVRIPAFVKYRRTTIGRMIVGLTYAVGALCWALSRKPRCVNIYLTQPPLYLAVIPVLKLIKGGRFICIINDLYPHVAVAAGILPENSRGNLLLKKMLVWALRRSDVVIAIGRCMRERLVLEGVDEKRIQVIENWTDSTKVYPVSRINNPLASKLHIGDEFVVLYSGNMGMAHEFETLLSVAEDLKGQGIRFVLIGDGVKRKQIEHRVKERDLGNVTLVSYLEEEWLRFGQALGDVHFISLISSFTGIVVPSKTYSAMAAGRPVIYEGDADGEIARLIMEESFGYVIHPGDREELKQAILKLAENRRLADGMGQRARASAEGRYGKQRALERYMEVIEGRL